MDVRAASIPERPIIVNVIYYLGNIKPKQKNLSNFLNCWKERMVKVQPVTLEGHGIRLEPRSYEHQEGLAAAVMDGKLWELWFTFVPEPE